jgi:Domain of unknown function (DUF4389)
VTSYVFLAANPFPGFTGAPGSYPIDLEVDPPGRQSRWKTAFRIVLAVPVLILLFVLDGTFGGGNASDRDSDRWFLYSIVGVTFSVAFLAWFTCLARGRMPRGFRNVLAYALRYSAQAYGYLLILTERYPNADPILPAEVGTVPPYPLRLTVADDLRRSRLTVFFRLLLALPHIAWLLLWGIAAVLGGDRQLVRDARDGAVAGFLARLSRRLRPVLDSRAGLPDARREPVSRLRRPAGGLSGRRRD